MTLIGDIRPCAIYLQAGEDYFWCTCGRSAQQPWCDGSHKGSEFKPKVFSVEQSDRYFICQCKKSQDAPFCDGSHKELDAAQLGSDSRTFWFRVLPAGVEVAEKEIRPVRVGSRGILLTCLNGRYGALQDTCPHDGGPLGEGSIECDPRGLCWLRCPRHGWEFDPITGEAGSDHASLLSYAVEKREDGIYVQIQLDDLEKA